MNYNHLCELYEQLEKTPSRLEKTQLIADFLKDVPKDHLQEIMLLIQGLAYPRWDERKLGFSTSYILKALAKATGSNEKAIKDVWKDTGDLGKTAQTLMEKRSQSTLFSNKLTIGKVLTNIQKLAAITGLGSVETKVSLIAELITSATALEAKFIVKTVLDELRIGTGEGTIRDAIVRTYLPRILTITEDYNKDEPLPKDTLTIENIEQLKDLTKYQHIYAEDEKIAREAYNWLIAQVEHAYNMTNDFGTVAQQLKEHGLKGLERLTLTAGTPIKVMLALKEETIQGAFKKVNKPAAIEYKLDGFRLQVHKKGEKIQLFTRRFEDVTKQFPDVVDAIAAHLKAEDCILDSETVGIDNVTNTFLPFQKISQRIKRKYEIEKMAKYFPVELHVFDIIELNGENLLDTPFKERRKLLEKIIKPNKSIKLIEQIQTDNTKKAEDFYKKSLNLGNEGVMFKSLDAPYKPGARVGHMIKMKPVMETLDLVIIGAEWGEGKRSAWLSSYILACRDEKTGELRTIGRVSTGLKEKHEEGLAFSDMTKLLKPLITKEEGKEVDVKAEIVIEINYEEIQKSPSYTSGYALRFPRVIHLREDRDAKSCSTLQDVERLYKGQ